MKAALLLLALGVLGIAAVWWYLTPAPGRKLFGGSAVVVKDITTQPQPKGKVAVAGSPKPVKRVLARAPEKSPEPSHNLAEGNQSPPPPPRPASFPFPTLAEVKIGTDRSQIINEFGPPALSASTQDRGHLFETYVYKRGRTKAIIHLRDTRVTDLY